MRVCEEFLHQIYRFLVTVGYSYIYFGDVFMQNRVLFFHIPVSVASRDP